MNFAQSLDLILQPEDQSLSAISRAVDIANQMHQAQIQFRDLKHQLRMLKSEINSQLAVKIRKAMPSLNISVDRNGNCQVGYKSKYLIVNPDTSKGMWSVKSNDPRFCSRFQRRYKHDLFLDENVDNLINRLCEYFTGYYKSLGESIEGTGKIIIEGKTSSFADLVNWREHKCQH